jgi:hypothetical protein
MIRRRTRADRLLAVGMRLLAEPGEQGGEPGNQEGVWWL